MYLGLGKKRTFKILFSGESPVSYCLYSDLIRNIISIEKPVPFEKYLFYRENFINLKKSKSGRDLGFESNNAKVSFYIDRGHTKEESYLLLSERQKTLSDEKLKKIYGADGKEAEEIRKKTALKISNSNKSFYDSKGEEFKKSFGTMWKKSIKKSINPKTGSAYTEDEAESLISNKCSEFTKKVDYKNLDYNTKIEFYLRRGYTEKESKEMLSNRQKTNSLWRLKNIYGESKGLDKYISISEKKKTTWSSKSKEDLIDHAIKTFPRNRYSRSSYEFFSSLDLKIKKEIFEEISPKIFYGDSEYFLRDEKKVRFYDFTIPDIGIIIEYHGIAFHPREDLRYYPGIQKYKFKYGGLSFDEKKKYDDEKDNLARKNGYAVIYVWEDDNLETKIDELTIIIKEKYNKIYGN